MKIFGKKNYFRVVFQKRIILSSKIFDHNIFYETFYGKLFSGIRFCHHTNFRTFCREIMDTLMRNTILNGISRKNHFPIKKFQKKMFSSVLSVENCFRRNHFETIKNFRPTFFKQIIKILIKKGTFFSM